MFQTVRSQSNAIEVDGEGVERATAFTSSSFLLLLWNVSFVAQFPAVLALLICFLCCCQMTPSLHCFCVFPQYAPAYHIKVELFCYSSHALGSLALLCLSSFLSHSPPRPCILVRPGSSLLLSHLASVLCLEYAPPRLKPHLGAASPCFCFLLI